ncbi:DUF3793 family protein [Gottschalkiaceae bacterium SANA]|nr:DUF3793 family protein [Gottschalkiaceae bacterium SANA]
MNSFLKNWITGNAQCDYRWCSFCSSIGIVYTGVKPAEIINVSVEQLRRCVMLRDCIEFKVITRRKDQLSIFIFNRESMRRSLSNRYALDHLQKLGYPLEFDVDEYISMLVGKLKGDNLFPHEIGFFLGYPVKDVLGFMNMLNLPHTKTMGWRMYGDTKESEVLYHKVKNAKNEIVEYALSV